MHFCNMWSFSLYFPVKFGSTKTVELWHGRGRVVLRYVNIGLTLKNLKLTQHLTSLFDKNVKMCPASF